MPELAEVEYMRRRWLVGVGDVVESAGTHPRARIFRESDAAGIASGLGGARMTDSSRSGKQMLLAFGDRGWLALHLGMTGELLVCPAGHQPGRHDHLILRQRGRSLVFRDPRMFGAVSWHPGAAEPSWWKNRPPEILDRKFTRALLAEFLARRGRAPIKAVLLMQERFPGIGNWMADEVLWRAEIDPARPAGSLSGDEVKSLNDALRFVCRGALRSVVKEKNGTWGDPPRGWLFHVRWADGGRCPRSGAPLRRDIVGGRTTCWSPTVQR